METQTIAEVTIEIVIPRRTMKFMSRKTFLAREKVNSSRTKIWKRNERTEH
jgi:hypothetical protein